MKNKKGKNKGFQQEVNLKTFFQKIFKHKYLFLASIAGCMALALGYIFISTPKYEVSTSLLIDSSGSNRVLGESKYVEGGVSLIEMEKNLYNEIGILKSFSLINQTIKDLNFDVSYFSGKWPKKREHYQDFPFKVRLAENAAQLYGVPFEIEIVSREKYRLSISGKDFMVLNPEKETVYEVNKDFSFSEIFRFNQTVNHDYFNFKLEKSDAKGKVVDFEENLSFVVQNPVGITNFYMDNLGVNNIDIQASIFKITSTGQVIDKEVEFLKKLTDNYIKNKLNSRNRIATSKETFIQNQLKEISDSLVKVEAKLASFKKGKNALDLGETVNKALDQTQNLQIRRAKLSIDINFYQTLIESVQSNRNSDDFAVPTAVGIEDQLINANIIELKELYAKRSKKKFFVTSNNEEMQILNKQIAESTDLLLSNLRNALKTDELALQRVNAQLSNVDGLINELPTQQNELLTIQRQSTLYENLFNYLSQELAKTGIARAESTSDTRVLDEARMAGTGPVAPQKMLLLTLAGIMGLLLPLVWIVVFSANDTIENVDQIMAHSNIPVIGSIVHHDIKTKSKNVEKDVGLWRFKESFRDLSINLKLVTTKKPSIVGITSILPEEGKTYNAINLGITLAESGKKTIVIDTDLRNPSLVNEMKNIEGKGLSNYLQGDLDAVGDIIYAHQNLANLDFIPTAVVSSNVHELLSGSRIRELLTSLEDRYDYIILDTPAVGLVSDFLLLWDVFDINLFIVRRKIAKIKFLGDIEHLIPRKKKKKNFIIFNDALAKDHKYGYDEKYGRNRETQLVHKSFTVKDSK